MYIIPNVLPFRSLALLAPPAPPALRTHLPLRVLLASAIPLPLPPSSPLSPRRPLLIPDQCVKRAGNTGVECIVDIGPNATKNSLVCGCSSYGGVMPEGGFTTAQYTYGADKCSTANSAYYFNAALCCITITLLICTMLYAFYVSFSLRKSCSRNVTNTTLAWTTAATVAHVLWHATVFASNVVMKSQGPMVNFQKPVGIPLFGIMQTFVRRRKCVFSMCAPRVGL